MIEHLLFSEPLKEVIHIAQAIAREYHHANFSGAHLLKALLHENAGLTGLLQSLGKDLFYLRDWADFRIENLSRGTSRVEAPAGDEGITRVFNAAELIRSQLGQDAIEPVSALLALLQPDNAFSKEMLHTLPLTAPEIREALVDESGLQQAVNKSEKADGLPRFLLKYCRDKTEMARQGALDPVVGRDREIGMVFEILGRRVKNNVMIIGEPGVGKTAIIDGLAQRIAEDTVPSYLKTTLILELDVKSLIAGATYKGEFEDRLKNILKELRQLGQAILFIDEIHALLESGGAAGPSMGDMLKPELSRGEITLIGATTLEEYRQKVESDKALIRRFESVMIEEPDEENALEMLSGVIPKYETHHQLSISRETLKESIRLARRYLRESRLPDAAIDLIDRSFSALKLANETAEEKDKKRMLDVEDIAASISKSTGIPLGRIQMQEREKLLQMETWLTSRIISQERAVQAIAEAIRESRSGLSQPGKPMGSFFLLGPTGTGKTETAKALAAFLFDDEQAMIRFDMSEFKEEHAAALLYGAPPGYVGYKEGGMLVNKIRQKPYSVVLFDEIEKAHSSVYDVFLQILDEGKIHDKLGNIGNFSDSVIFFTSNVGSEWLVKRIKAGDMPDSRELQAALRGYFRPEFLGRLTDIIPFAPLDEKSMAEIFHIQMKSLYHTLAERQITLEIADEALQRLVKQGYHPEFGARPLAGVIRNEIRRPLSMKLINGEVQAGNTIRLTADPAGNLAWEVLPAPESDAAE